jgi:hypothetical protein
MNKIFLFGDSYFDSHPYMNQQDHENWYDRLERYFQSRYHLHNLAESGTGPHSMLPLIERYVLDNKITKGDIIICNVSGVDRIVFPKNDAKISDGEMMKIGYDTVSRNSYCTVDKITDREIQDRERYVLNYYNNFRSEIDFACLTFHDIICGLARYTTSFLYMISQSLKVKTIVFSTSIDMNAHYRHLNNEFFHYSDYNLFDVSRKEVFDDSIGHVKRDLRNNHFSIENHLIMNKYLINVINDEKPLPIFKENFRKHDDVYKIISENSETKFIYD